MDKSIKKPNFFIIGAPKCGTTALYMYLNEHPDIFLSPIKEPDFFATDFNRSITNINNYLKLFEGADVYKIVGEASTTYLSSKEAVKNILKFNPEAKFIVMIRNPVDMFSSLHSQNLINLNENIRDAERAWKLQKKRKKGQFIPSTCKEPKLLQYGDMCKLGDQTKRLYRIVPNKSNIKIIKFNEFTNETRKVYEEILSFLEARIDGKKEFPVYGKSSRLKSKTIKRLSGNIPKNSCIKKLSSFVKDKLRISYWPFLKGLNEWNRQEVLKKPLDEVFEQELKNYFKEDQRLLVKLIKNYTNEK